MNGLPPVSARLFVVSPHLDDAVFGCGRLLRRYPGATVLTVFAGSPPATLPLTEWDRAAGFGARDDVIARRREEDRRALTLLGARPLWLDFLDAQYGATPPVEEVAAAIARELEHAGADQPVMPLGLFHSDHALVHAACVSLLRRGGSWLAYEEPMYRLVPDLLDRRLAELRAAGIAVAFTGSLCATPSEPKHAAVAAYASQLRALATPGRPGHLDAFAPERFWSLHV